MCRLNPRHLAENSRRAEVQKLGEKGFILISVEKGANGGKVERPKPKQHEFNPLEALKIKILTAVFQTQVLGLLDLDLFSVAVKSLSQKCKNPQQLKKFSNNTSKLF